MSTSVFDMKRTQPRGTLEPGGHGVEFYGYDAQIVRKVADFLAPGLDGHDAAVVIATAPHRSAIDGELAARGIDVRAARASGRLQMLDAATTLSKFIVGDEPNAERFEQVIGRTVANAQSKDVKHVRAYGEMVALLWLAGRPRSALRVERLWNDLASRLSFTLLCGYPISAFGPDQAEEIAEIGRTHTQIAPLQRVVSTVRV